MRGRLFKGLVVATLIALVAVPAASARSTVRVKLSVLPLPASSLTSAARSLPLERGSGFVRNKNPLAAECPTTPNRWLVNAPVEPGRQLGRVSGYALDYGLGTSGRAGVTEVWTGVDEYKSSADAKRALALWRRYDRLPASLLGRNFSVAAANENVAAVGGERFGVLVSYSASNIAPLFGLDEQLTIGRYEADVTVWAGTAAAAEKLAPRLAKKLARRIRLALAGRLHAKPVKLPAKPKAGPSPGGPDLARLALQTSDLSGAATADEEYLPEGFGLSFYDVSMSPAGQFSELSQEIFWFPTANAASFYADDLIPPGDDSLGLSDVGDGARGLLSNGGFPDEGGASVVYSSGRLDEVLGINDTNALQPSQIKGIAQTVADKINAAGLGS